MNAVKEIARINQRELELGLGERGSWHDEYRDSAYVFIGGLNYDLTEGDVVTIFSQWGEVVDINLPRDKESGKAKGFGFLMYEDQRSTVLAVDNMNGAQVLGRTIRVDHCKKYKQAGTKNEAGEHIEPEEPSYNVMPPLLEDSGDESSDSEPADDLDEEDPMAAFIRAEKKKEKAQRKAITSGTEAHKGEGESKEERRARRDAKRARKEERDRKRRDKQHRAEAKINQSRRSPHRDAVREARDDRPNDRKTLEYPRAGNGGSRRDGYEDERARESRFAFREERYSESARKEENPDDRFGSRSPVRGSRDRYSERDDARRDSRFRSQRDYRYAYEDERDSRRRSPQ